ncbi:hypothetical protein BZA05DRAFT_246273 [Tricharina praecox]|uniref:uncharacterized protein n=1 Tax=Tricharina praecox TaxID=43433 RepID=UPI002220EEB8|nr:uncharacterized protein BZA05DRAFT_246273 [Tricharina praecox]KAI5854627.1 hypothetical protein BZA05DRAFT_246273 [Tricharina praecox]
MHFGRPLICAFVALLFCAYLGSCGSSPELRPRTAVALIPRQATASGGEDGPTQTRSSGPQSTVRTSSDRASSTSTPAADRSSSVSAAPAASGTDIFEGGRQDETSREVYAGGLPIPPKVTPGLGVAGIFLMIAGLCCSLVGIKIKRVHIFLSSAYLVSLAVTVLIVYVMNPPVGNAIQGAYVVAVVMTGTALGGLAIVFPEVTEGLGCLLGGFCLSMWFLVLKPGGLLTSVYGKLILIGAFCLVVFALAFHRVTRPWGLIGSLSFAGSTSLILGIDCFSRAGLKEFWLYIWALNDNLFPLGTDTYPHTRGMKVEIAAIIVVFAVGVMSQMKLWKILQERRGAKDAARRLQEADLEAVDAETGRRVEAEYQEERGKWEATYGDKDKKDASAAVRPVTGGSKTDSGLGDDETRASGEVTEGFGHIQTMGSTGGESSRRHSESPEDPDGISTLTDDQGLKPPQKSAQNSRRNSSEAASRRHSSQSLRRQSTQTAKDEEDQDAAEKSAGPVVIPLPFQCEGEDDNRSEGSSVAARADNDHFSVIIEEQEGLDMPVFSFNRASWASSLAATCDDRLDEEDDGLPELGRNSTILDPKDLDPKDIALPMSPRVSMQKDAVEGPFADGARTSIDSPEGPVDTASIVTPNSSSAASKGPPPVLPQDLVPASFPKSKAESTASRGTFEVQTQCSKVVKTYRTNEWAKHLSEADKPELDDLSRPQAADEDDEQPAHLDFQELQGTTEGAPKPVSRKEARRSTSFTTPLPSSTSATAPTRSSFRSNSVPLPIPETPPTEQSPSPPPVAPEPVAHAFPPFPLVERATSAAAQREDRFPKQGTLLGQRENLVRNRASITALDAYGGSSPLVGPLPIARTTTDPYRSASAMNFAPSRAPTPLSRGATPISRVATPQSRGSTSQSPQVLSDDMPLADRQQILHLQTRRSWSSTQRHPTPIPQQYHDKRTDVLHALNEGLQMQETAAAAHLVDQRRAEMLDERKHAAVLERQKLAQGNLRGGLMEERMRQKDMLELHQEALRKMQRQANKHAM